MDSGEGVGVGSGDGVANGEGDGARVSGWGSHRSTGPGITGARNCGAITATAERAPSPVRSHETIRLRTLETTYHWTGA